MNSPEFDIAAEIAKATRAIPKELLDLITRPLHACPLCAGSGRIFVEENRNGRIFRVCSCPAGEPMRKLNASCKARIHFEDELRSRDDI